MIAVNFLCIDSILTKSSTAQCNYKGSNGFLSSYWMNSATRWSWVVMSHWWTSKLHVFMATQVSIWHIYLTSFSELVPIHSSIPGNPLSTSVSMGGKILKVSLTSIFAENIHKRDFFFCLSLGVPWGSTNRTLISEPFFDIHTGLLSVLLSNCGGFGGITTWYRWHN